MSDEEKVMTDDSREDCPYGNSYKDECEDFLYPPRCDWCEICRKKYLRTVSDEKVMELMLHKVFIGGIWERVIPKPTDPVMVWRKSIVDEMAIRDLDETFDKTYDLEKIRTEEERKAHEYWTQGGKKTDDETEHRHV